TDLALTDGAGRATIHALLLNRTEGQFRVRITAVKEQSRAGIVAFQTIGAGKVAAGAAPQPAASAKPRSPGLTPTTVKMSHGVSKKWIILGALAAGGGAAAVGASRARSSKSVPSSTVSIGTPTIT